MRIATIAKPPPQTEREFLSEVVELSRALGWRTYHPWLSIRSERGWPDLALVSERLILAELKTDNGKLTPAQSEWLVALSAAGVECYVWRPADFDGIVSVLSRGDPLISTASCPCSRDGRQHWTKDG